MWGRPKRQDGEFDPTRPLPARRVPPICFDENKRPIYKPSDLLADDFSKPSDIEFTAIDPPTRRRISEPEKD
jgi:hypothetical protein